MVNIGKYWKIFLLKEGNPEFLLIDRCHIKENANEVFMAI